MSFAFFLHNRGFFFLLQQDKIQKGQAIKTPHSPRFISRYQIYAHLFPSFTQFAFIDFLCPHAGVRPTSVP